MRRVLSSCFVLAVGAAGLMVETRHAAGEAGPGTLENYSIRDEPQYQAQLPPVPFYADAAAGLRLEIPAAAVEPDPETGFAEVIAAGAAESRSLTGAAAGKPEDVLRGFLRRFPGLFGLTRTQISQLGPANAVGSEKGRIRVVELVQSVNGVPVFQASVKAGLGRRNEIVRVVNHLAPGVDEAAVSYDFGAPEIAAAAAADYVGVRLAPAELKPVAADAGSVTFEPGPFADRITAERSYFPLRFGELRPAWRVLLWTRDAAYYVIVDAADQKLLWRKNLTQRQTQSSTFSVYGDPYSLTRAADSPTPGTPGCPNPLTCPQPSMIGRSSFTLIGNEPPYTFNNNGWIADGENRTIGNAAEAGIDRDGTQGIDPNGWAFSDPGRNFVFAYDPAPGLAPPGQSPLPTGTQTYPPTQFQQGSVTNAFYLVNRWHDEAYLLGFNESSRNFQTDNFGRGGLANDSISVEVQDGSGSNSANFTTPADGNRPRAQFFVWTASTPARDGALDAQIVLHEINHGMSSRLVGNATGLTGNMAGGMGEGWSDFFALSLLAEPSDDPFGIHAFGCYSSFRIIAGYEANCYYGLRRFPYARIGSTGPNGLPHNPLTFRYLNSNCNTLIGTTVSDPPPNSAFPRGPIGTTTCDQVHNIGEIWASALWEVRASLIDTHGPAEGNRRALAYVIDGMKLSPLNPTMLQMRDAILAAAQASSAADVRRVWRGFAIRGMGLSASIQNAGTGSNNTSVTESFDSPYVRPAADFDGDGRTDISVFRPAERNWYLLRSNAGFTAATFGSPSDTPVPADFDGDRKTDIAVFRPAADPAEADLYVLRSSNFAVSYVSWGVPGDVSAVADFDGDGKADPAVFRPSASRFYVLQSSNGALLLSRPMLDSTPVSGDFDGDGKADFATFGAGRWSMSRSSDNHQSGELLMWGLAGDRVTAADYDGDGRTDAAVFRPSDGVWYIKKSSGSNAFLRWGIDGDIPSPGDYDGDGRADAAVYRNGVWYINRSSSGVQITQFGLTGDVPLPASVLPQ